MGWQPLYDSWKNTLPSNLKETDIDLVEILF